MSERLTMRVILLVQALGFIIIAAFLWLDELVDLPHVLYGTPETPINYSEVFMESALVILLGAIVMAISVRLMRRIMELESLFSTCIVCEKVCVPGADPEVQASWKEVDTFKLDRAGSHFSSSICPECRARCESGEPVKRP